MCWTCGTHHLCLTQLPRHNKPTPASSPSFLLLRKRKTWPFLLLVDVHIQFINNTINFSILSWNQHLRYPHFISSPCETLCIFELAPCCSARLELLPVTVFELLLPCCYSPPCSIINSSTFLLSLPLRWRLQLLPLPLFQSTIIAVSSHLLEPTEPESCSFDPSSLVIIGLLKVLLSSSCSFFHTWTPPCRELSSPLRQASTSRWVSGDSC